MYTISLYIYPYTIKPYVLHTYTFVYRLQILQNIGAVFVKMGQYSDAMTSYEHVMSEKPSVKAGQYMMYIHVITVL